MHGQNRDEQVGLIVVELKPFLLGFFCHHEKLGQEGVLPGMLGAAGKLFEKCQFLRVHLFETGIIFPGVIHDCSRFLILMRG